MDRFLHTALMRLICCLLLLSYVRLAHAQPIDLPGLPKEPFYSLAARGDTLLAAAVSGVYGSFDAGATWQALGRPAPDVTSMDALILTDSGWFAGAHGHGVYHSQDAGRTWQPRSEGLVGLGATSISAFQDRDGWLYAATDGAGVFRLDLSASGTWQRYGTEFAENEAETLVAMTMHEGVLVAAGGGNGLVLVENPAPATWTPVQVGGQTLDFTSTETALVEISPARCHFSLDGGRTWQRTGLGLASGFYAALASAGHTTYAMRSVAEGVSWLYRSSDLTAPWEFVAALSETLNMMVHGTRLYLAQADGLRAYSLVPVGTDPGDTPARPLRLDAPRPHPASGPTYLTFTLAHAGLATLSVHDALGRRVAILHEGMAPAGETSLTWSADSLPSGFYTLHLSAAGARMTQPLVVLR